jgi:pimeloyl-ACP methyl ester carboxylesterase
MCLIFSCLTSCSKYNAFRSKYTFRSPDGKPDYQNLEYWAAHPWKWDPSDSIPAPLANEPRDSMVDVFFLHPTTYTSKHRKKGANSTIDDDYTNAKTDYSSILYQASVFNNQCRVFAPRYRQGHISNFFSKNKEQAVAVFDLAYEDLKTAFEHYLRTWNGGRPIIIAGHSQGAMMAERLLKEYFDAKPLTNKLVVAYIIGWEIPQDLFTSLRPCADSLQTGCLCGWRTMRNGFIPRYLKKENTASLVTNPLNWTITSTYASRELNKGSVLTNFNKVFLATTDAQVRNGFLNVRKPKFPGSFFYFTRNYHIADINLFYMNMRENINRRIGMFWKK